MEKVLHKPNVKDFLDIYGRLSGKFMIYTYVASVMDLDMVLKKR